MHQNFNHFYLTSNDIFQVTQKPQDFTEQSYLAIYIPCALFQNLYGLNVLIIIHVNLGLLQETFFVGFFTY